MNGTMVTLKGTSTLSFRRSRLPSSVATTRNHFCNGAWPIPTYFKRFGPRTTNCCGCGELGTPLHLMSLTSSYNFAKSSNDLEHLWWKRVLNNPLSRIEIRKLINFISKNEDILFPPN
ncbi:hypothetical protein AVEN_229844-1 [Araneus ventricosus]|uniref:Uncharacterized protein n=1 Tax=Araneus ventricosus TaxID=182803 RepID=A0A4Y2RZR9_ARAVE|nr:hypothetical protein AVEN_229844-1 [Araneus ventricosus]